MADTDTTTPAPSPLGPAKVVTSAILIDKKTGKAVIDIPPDPVVVQPKPGTKITFEMYAVLKEIPWRNRAGMKAHTKANYETLASWENIFSNY